jgi:hypothetical protein
MQTADKTNLPNVRRKQPREARYPKKQNIRPLAPIWQALRARSHVKPPLTRVPAMAMAANSACRYLTFASEWRVFAPEFALLMHYRPECNDSGFGSKTLGVRRPGTFRVSQWNDKFPKST